MQASIKDIHGLTISAGEGLFHGADQDWFSSVWRRKAGCGPTTASNILRYMKDRAFLTRAGGNKQEMQGLMEWVWEYVTPGVFGLNSTELFREGMDKLLGELKSPLRCRVLDVPADERERPSIQRTADFFRQAFLADSPIAFLNLDRGALPGLESWHWVSLIAMDHEGDKLTATAADNGQLLGLDIGLWLETTKRSGGFVYLGE